MSLNISDLVPVPLSEKVDTYTSDIWKNTLTFQQGDLVFIQAPSGTGKTTLINMLYGLRTDYSGSINWYGKPVMPIDAEAIAKLRAGRISIVFQDLRLFPDLTAWENLEIKRCLNSQVTEEQAWEWMQRLGLGEKKYSLAATMSYGERQRLAIIRALLQPFDWLLMDEPFSHLDQVNIQKSIDLISEVVTTNKAGMILADLDENHYFPYTKTTRL